MARELWLMITADLPQKPEVMGIAERVKIDRWSAVGRLTAIWTWASEQTTDGHVRDAPVTLEASLDDVAGVTGFAQAMVDVGWLIRNGTTVIFPNFDRYCSVTAKTRALTANRMRKMRHARDGDSVTNSKSNIKSNKEEPPIPPVGGSSLGSEPTSRVQKRRSNPPPRDLTADDFLAESFPAAWLTDRFRSAWCGWVAQRKETRKPMTERAARISIGKLREWGYQAAIVAVERSIESTWAGVFRPQDDALDQVPTNAHQDPPLIHAARERWPDHVAGHLGEWVDVAKRLEADGTAFRVSLTVNGYDTPEDFLAAHNGGPTHGR